MADMVKFGILSWGDYPGLSRWVLNVITRVLVRGRQEGQGQTRCYTADFEGRRRSHKPRNGFLDKAKIWILP